MPEYGQFCPVAKASDIIGERWTVLILRELLLGTTRYNDFQRGLSRISPTLLSKRLKMLEEKGLVVRKRPPGAKSHEYHLTACGRELEPMIEHLAVWGMRWARGQMTDIELDVEFLMWDLQRRLQTLKLPDGETVLCFTFEELDRFRNWWLVAVGEEVDLCVVGRSWRRGGPVFGRSRQRSGLVYQYNRARPRQGMAWRRADEKSIARKNHPNTWQHAPNADDARLAGHLLVRRYRHCRSIRYSFVC
jgi:DNA-binding HxlR family transcriptional regulator